MIKNEIVYVAVAEFEKTWYNYGLVYYMVNLILDTEFLSVRYQITIFYTFFPKLNIVNTICLYYSQLSLVKVKTKFDTNQILLEIC